MLFKGWLIWAAFDRTELVGVASGSLLTLSLLPDQGHSLPDLGEVQCLDFLFLTYDLGDAVHEGRELHHNDHGLEVFGYFEAHSYNMGQVGNRLIDTKGEVFMV